MSYDFQITNKLCDHILRGVPCFVSDIDGLTLLPRNSPAQYTLSNPVFAGVSELKLYNQLTHSYQVINQNDPVYGWSFDMYPIIPGYPDMGMSAMIRFKQRQRNVQNIWRASYQVTSASCIKCNGANVLTDITLLGDPDRAMYVQFEAKLAQDFLKFILTPLGSDPYYKWIGTALMDLPGSKFNTRDLKNMLTSQIQSTGDVIKSLQAQQVTIPEQQVSTREMLNTVSSVSVQQAANDSREMSVNINLVTQSRTLSTIQFPFSNG